MKNNNSKKVLAALLYLAAVPCFLFALRTDAGAGSLDFSGVVKILLCVLAALLVMVGGHFFEVKSERAKKIKNAVLILSVAAIVMGAAIDNRMEMMAAGELLP